MNAIFSALTSALMPKKTTSLLLAVVAGAATFVGCGKVPETHFYTLEPPSVSPVARKLPYDVSVARFRAGYRLSQDRLVYMPAPYHVDFYTYHRWAGYPSDLVTLAMITALKQANLFRSVSEIKSGVNPDFVLRGEVQNLEELDAPGSATARVAITLDAQDAKTRNIVWSGSARYEKQVISGNIDDVARELNEGVRQTLDKLVQDMAQNFPEKKPN